MRHKFSTAIDLVLEKVLNNKILDKFVNLIKQEIKNCNGSKELKIFLKFLTKKKNSTGIL